MKLHNVKIFTDENISPKVVAFRENSDTNSSLIARGMMFAIKRRGIFANRKRS
jgi:hypothetical protein